MVFAGIHIGCHETIRQSIAALFEVYAIPSNENQQPLQHCLYLLVAEQTGDGFGNAASCVEVGSGEFLLSVGAPNEGASNRGIVYVYKIRNSKQTLNFQVYGDKNRVNPGQMFISFPGDLDQNGIPEVYASDFSDNSKVCGGGNVVVHFGRRDSACHPVLLEMSTLTAILTSC